MANPVITGELKLLLEIELEKGRWTKNWNHGQKGKPGMRKEFETKDKPMKIEIHHLSQIAGNSKGLIAELTDQINLICPRYGIDNLQRYSHFLAQACHETDHFNTLREYASGKAYEGRADLGNTQPGDGVKYKGRGIFQTTGRKNYLRLGISKGKHNLFIDNPQLLEQPEHAVWSACEYWKNLSLNNIADQEDSTEIPKRYKGKIITLNPIEFISVSINGGYNGMEDRKIFYGRAKTALKD